ncbi:MAG: class I SAM-dependent DNA methyltransferase, partial [Gammaproteobacteria bacterium]
LERAYGLQSPADSSALYRDWAASYEHTMLDGLGYISPARLAELLAGQVMERDVTVLDVGCGTGLAGGCLARHGFSVIDGIDISPEMLGVARASGLYRSLFIADLTEPLAIDDGAYGAAICTGTFTHGHVGAGCLREIFRILRPGALFACTIHRDVWDAMGFGAELEALVRDRVIDIRVAEDGPYYRNSPAPDGRYCVIARL